MNARELATRAYETSREEVYRYLARMGVTPAEAQEITQDVFLKLFQALQSGEDILNPRAWAFRVAHNMGVNQLTRQRPAEPVDPLESRLAHPASSAEDELIESERQARLARALDSLSPQQRQCLHLRAEGLKYREIAETLGLSVSTVNEFLARAVARLQKATNE